MLSWFVVAVTAGSASIAAPADPAAIIGGVPAGECVWPTTVAVHTSGGLCTGSLVHPSIVVYAAHCGASAPRVRLGQHADAFAIEPAIEVCETNPDYLGVSDSAHDWAYCRLAEPVLGVPITPPLYGCEVDAIEAGAPVVIAGFGQSAAGSGAGPKRWASAEIVSTFGATATIGDDTASTCAGDSGGSAFMALQDGGWRAISMVSAGAQCQSAVHALMHRAVPWIEERSGVDITPCHDVDGTWAPGPDCDGLYAGTPDDEASWDDACSELPRTGKVSTCGEPFMDDGGGSESSGDDGEVPPEDADTGGGSESGDDGLGEGSDGDAATTDAAADRSSGGCRVAGQRRSWWWMWIVVVALCRRRDRGAACARGAR